MVPRLSLCSSRPHRRAREAGAVPGHYGDPCPPSPHCSGTLTGGLSFPSVCREQSFFAGGRARLAKLGPCAQKRPHLGRSGSPGLGFYSPKWWGFSTAVHLEGLLAAVPLGIQRGLVSQVPWVQHLSELSPLFAQEPRWAGLWAPRCGSGAWMGAQGGPGAGGGHVGVCAEGCELTFPPTPLPPSPGRRQAASLRFPVEEEDPGTCSSSRRPRGPYTWQPCRGADAGRMGALAQGPRTPRAAAGRAPSLRV